MFVKYATSPEFLRVEVPKMLDRLMAFRVDLPTIGARMAFAPAANAARPSGKTGLETRRNFMGAKVGGAHHRLQARHFIKTRSDAMHLFQYLTVTKAPHRRTPVCLIIMKNYEGGVEDSRHSTVIGVYYVSPFMTAYYLLCTSARH